MIDLNVIYRFFWNFNFLKIYEYIMFYCIIIIFASVYIIICYRTYDSIVWQSDHLQYWYSVVCQILVWVPWAYSAYLLRQIDKKKFGAITKSS